jgi:hypothetical protein
MVGERADPLVKASTGEPLVDPQRQHAAGLDDPGRIEGRREF